VLSHFFMISEFDQPAAAAAAAAAAELTVRRAKICVGCRTCI